MVSSSENTNFGSSYNYDQAYKNIYNQAKLLRQEREWIRDLSTVVNKNDIASQLQYKAIRKSIKETLSLIPGNGKLSLKDLKKNIQQTRLDPANQNQAKLLEVIQKKLQDEIIKAKKFLGEKIPSEREGGSTQYLVQEPSHRTAGGGSRITSNSDRRIASNSDGTSGGDLKDDVKSPNSPTLGPL